MPITPRPAPAGPAERFDGFIRHGRRANGGDKMLSGGEQRQDDGGAGVIGVRHQIERLGDGKIAEQGDEFIEERAPVAIAEDDPLVDPAGQG